MNQFLTQTVKKVKTSGLINLYLRILSIDFEYRLSSEKNLYN